VVASACPNVKRAFITDPGTVDRDVAKRIDEFGVRIPCKSPSDADGIERR